MSSGLNAIGNLRGKVNASNALVVTLDGGTASASVFLAGDGTAAAPSYSFTSDPAFGWWTPAASRMTLTDGTTATRLDVGNTWTSLISHESFSVDWQTTANTARVGTRTAATGTGRELQLVSQLSSAGDAYASIRVNGSTVPFVRAGYFNAAGTQTNGFANTGNLITLAEFGIAAAGGTQVSVAIIPTINQSATAAATDLLINRTQTAVGSGAQLLIDAQVSTASKFAVNNLGSLTKIGAITTAGLMGAPGVVAVGRVTAQSAANASISTFTVGAADASFEISANMNVTASTALTTTLTCTYTDEASTAQTMVLPIVSLSGTFVAAGAITGAGATVWHTPVMHIRAKAATAITILTTAGTFTGVTYTAEGVIKQTK